ncbi:MAG: glycosyltransferase involved in cell wall biosynthesis [Ascidiaceihabitans sp.]|jgi:glycosyltransferase involved in cell wall biosynthesis
MHIMHLVTRLLRAGSEENTIETCRAQVLAGHQVTLVHGRDFDPYWYDNPIPGIRLMSLPEMAHPIQIFADMRAYQKLRQLFVEFVPDVIHTHQSKAGILGRLASAVLSDVFVVHGIHIVPFEGMNRAKRWLYIWSERLAARNTDLYIGVSNAVCQSFTDAGIAGQNQMKCVRSGIALGRFRSGQWPGDWSALLGVSHVENRPPVALMMAAFEKRKRHVPFLQAFAQVRQTVPDLKIILAGKGPEEQVIRKVVFDLGLQDHVVFCGHRSDPEALFAMADVSVLVSQKEGLPRVLIQSLASGVPMILNDLAGLDEVLTNGLNGVMTPPDDVCATVNQMAQLLTDDLALSRLRQGVLETDVSDWDLASFGLRTTQLYRPANKLSAHSEIAAE